VITVPERYRQTDKLSTDRRHILSHNITLLCVASRGNNGRFLLPSGVFFQALNTWKLVFGPRARWGSIRPPIYSRLGRGTSSLHILYSLPLDAFGVSVVSHQNTKLIPGHAYDTRHKICVGLVDWSHTFPRLGICHICECEQVSPIWSAFALL